eukprot:Gb_28222 [translate_table: standard]
MTVLGDLEFKCSVTDYSTSKTNDGSSWHGKSSSTSSSSVHKFIPSPCLMTGTSPLDPGELPLLHELLTCSDIRATTSTNVLALQHFLAKLQLALIPLWRSHLAFTTLILYDVIHIPGTLSSSSYLAHGSILLSTIDFTLQELQFQLDCNPLVFNSVLCFSLSNLPAVGLHSVASCSMNLHWCLLLSLITPFLKLSHEFWALSLLLCASMRSSSFFTSFGITTKMPHYRRAAYIPSFLALVTPSRSTFYHLSSFVILLPHLLHPLVSSSSSPLGFSIFFDFDPLSFDAPSTSFFLFSLFHPFALIRATISRCQHLYSNVMGFGFSLNLHMNLHVWCRLDVIVVVKLAYNFGMPRVLVVFLVFQGFPPLHLLPQCLASCKTPECPPLDYVLMRSLSSTRLNSLLESAPLEFLSKVFPRQIFDPKTLELLAYASCMRDVSDTQVPTFPLETPTFDQRFSRVCGVETKTRFKQLERTKILELWGQNMQDLGICEDDDHCEGFHMLDVDLTFENYEDIFGGPQGESTLMFEDVEAACSSMDKDVSITYSSAQKENALKISSGPQLAIYLYLLKNLEQRKLPCLQLIASFKGEPAWGSASPDSAFSQARDNAMMRYKEKKGRMFEKRTCYASRKARVDVRKCVYTGLIPENRD